MQTYDVTLDGYDGDTDATDHLVKWVRAESPEAIQRWLTSTGLHCVVSDWEPRIVEHAKTFEDGVDLILNGDTAETEDGKPFDPQTWIDEADQTVHDLLHERGANHTF